MCMADRPVLGSREQLVAQLFVEPGRLEGEALEIRVAAATLDRAPLRRLQESPAVAPAAQRLGYPQDSHVEHAAPDEAQHATHDLVTLVVQEEVDRRVRGE